MNKIILILFLSFSFCYAHGLNIFVNEDNKTLHVKAYFSKSSPCQGCDVSLYTVENILLAQHVTDEKGEVSFPLLAQKLHIKVKASMGHQHEIVFSSDTPIEEAYPLWIKILLGLIIIATFFAGLKFARKTQ